MVEVVDIDWKPVMAKARVEVRQYLHAVAQELLVWRDTGILPSGRLRAIAAPLRDFAPSDAVRIAEGLARDAALEVVSGRSPDPRILAAATWREAERLADEARAHAADVHQGIEPGNIKAPHRAAQYAEREARVARDGYDAAVRVAEAGDAGR